jgi:hypothetical protein
MNPFYLFRIALYVAVWMLPAAMQAQFTFTTTNGSLMLTGYLGSDRSVLVPASTNGLAVGLIGRNAFASNSSIFSISIPASVTNYAVGSFVRCSNLTAVYFAGSAPKDFYPAAAGVFSQINATLYYVQGATGWTANVDGLQIQQWNPQIVNQLSFTTNDNAITITSYTGPGGTVVIPATINGYLVRGIGDSAFLNASSVTSVTIPATVTNVGNQAFAGCTALTSVAVQPGVFGMGLFSNCTALANAVILTNVGSIAPFEFSGCSSLRTITIPGTVTNIGAGAFQNCSNLNALYFQGNAPATDPTAFSGSTNATNYYLPKAAGWGATLAGQPVVPVLFTFVTNGSAITITRYIGIWGSVTVPDFINNLPVTTLANGAFLQVNSLTNINIGTNIHSINGQAFVTCSNLLAINVDPLNSVYSSLDGVLFNKSRNSILYYPGGRIGSYTIPDGVTTIPSYAFQSSYGLTTLIVPGSVTSIGSLAFNVDPSLTAIYFRGNAPIVASFGFALDNIVTVYYLPGTTGWSSNLGGLPTAPWQPAVATDDGSFGIRTNSFGFNINWTAGMTVVVDASTNLLNPIWLPLNTNTMTGDSVYFNDPFWTNYPSRYYRLQSQ